MSYCRFENTLGDLEDCHEAADILISGGGDSGEKALSRVELKAAKKLVAAALELVTMVAENAGVDLDKLDERAIADYLDNVNDKAAKMDSDDRDSEDSYNAERAERRAVN